MTFGRVLQNANALRHDFLADPIAGNDCDAILA